MPKSPIHPTSQAGIMHSPVLRKCQISLIELIESDVFDIKMALHYLFKADNDDIRHCICDKFLNYDISVVSSHLLQIIQIYIKISENSPYLLSVIKKLSFESVSFSLLSTWMLQSFLKDSIDKECIDRIKNLITVIICCNIPHASFIDPFSSDFGFNQVNFSICDSDKGDIKSVSNDGEKNKKPENTRQKTKGDLYLQSRSFFHDLTNVGNRLLGISKELRLGQLKTYIKKLNKTIGENLSIPYVSARSHKIVRISPNECTLLSSKEKVPFLIFFEVIEEICTSAFSNRRSSKEYQLKHLDNNEPFTSYFDEEEHSQSDNEESESQKNVYQVVFAMDVRKQIGSCERYSNEGLHSNTEESISEERNKEDELAYETWSMKYQRMKRSSPYSHQKGWNVYPVIVKCGDDLRQDLLAYELLKTCLLIWEEENTGLWIKPYEIVIVSQNSGLIEAITDSVSLHHIKQKKKMNLYDYFVNTYGQPGSETFTMSQKEFVKSLAAYSIFQYIFRIKDRHNSNILLDSKGHIIHIDFGYMLAITPGNISFETSPFKMTAEYIQLMEGVESDVFLYFRSLMCHGMFALQKHMDKLVHLIEVMHDSNISCIGNGQYTVDSLKLRFHANLPDDLFSKIVDELIYKSISSYTTKIYDSYQYYTNGIL